MISLFVVPPVALLPVVVPPVDAVVPPVAVVVPPVVVLPLDVLEPPVVMSPVAVVVPRVAVIVPRGFTRLRLCTDGDGTTNNFVLYMVRNDTSKKGGDAPRAGYIRIKREREEYVIVGILMRRRTKCGHLEDKTFLLVSLILSL